MSDYLKIDWLGGNCPLQAEGAIDGVPFYFRARGKNWSFCVGDDPINHPTWEYGESYGDGPFDAGWMTTDEALSFIRKAAAMYMERRP